MVPGPAAVVVARRWLWLQTECVRGSSSSPEGDWSRSNYLRGGVLLAMMISLALPWRRVLRVCLYPRQYLPDFITNAKWELMDSNAFFCKFTRERRGEK